MSNIRNADLKTSLRCLAAAVSMSCMMILFLSPLAQRSDAFSMTDFSPSGRINGPEAVRITFDSQMISSEDIGKNIKSPADDGSPITISPMPAAGTGKWLNDRTFTYTPSPGYLMEATEYRVALKDGLVDANGSGAAGTKTFSFSTPPLEFRGVRQTASNPVHNFVEYQLMFSIPVDHSRLEGFLAISDKEGKPVRIDYLDPRPSTAVGIRVGADDGSPLALKIEKGLSSIRGPLGLEEAVSREIERDLSLKIGSSSVQNMYDGAYIYIETNGQVDVEKAKSFVELTPDTKFSLESYDGVLQVRGDFNPRDRVTLKLKKGLPALIAPPLEEDWSRSFIFPDIDPSIGFASQGRFISPAAGELMLPITSVNIEKIDLTVRRVYDNNVPVVARVGWPYYAADMSEEIFKKTYRISSKPNERVKSSIDLKKILDGRKGLFEIYLEKPDDYWGRTSANRIINVTDIAGTAKIYETGALVWANSISGGTPAEGVTAAVYSSSHQLLAEGTTDSNGLWHYKADAPWKENLRPDLIVLTRDDDVSLLRLDSGIWRRGDSDFEGMPYSQGEYLGICYTPRGVFRPGESVPIQILIRGHDLSMGEPFPVLLKVRTSLGREWKSVTLGLSEMGMASELIKLSDASPTGTWEASVYIPGEDAPIASTWFFVEDFAPPRIAVETSSDKRAVMPGDDGKLFISSKYLFGAPADGLSYEVELTTIPREYSHPDWKGFLFSDERVTFAPSTSKIASGNLSRTGDAVVSFSPPLAAIPSVLDIALRVGVMEDGGRWAYKSLTLPYYPRKTMMGIRRPDGTITTGTSLPFEFAAIDTDGKRAGIADAVVTLYRQRTYSIVSAEGNRRRTELKTEYVPVEGYDAVPLSFDVQTPKIDIEFEKGGYYLLAVENKAAGSSAAVWIYAYDAAWNYGESATQPESLNIVMDKPLYKAGETATVKVSGAFGGSVLMTVETGEIIESRVASSDKGNATFSFQVTESMTPNAWVTAHLIRPVAPEEPWASFRAFGAAPINVDASHRALNVVIEPPSRLKTWNVNEFGLELTDSLGNGVKGEVSLMLVDDGVLSLTNYKTPDFLAYYMSRRGLSIEAYDIYSELLPLYLENPKVLTPGGGAMGDMALASQREASLSPVRADRFKILTLWKRIETDEAGKARFTFTLPEFTGRARLMALAASERAFGSAEASFEVARDVVSELSLPRVMAPKDVIESGIQLFNKTGKSIDVDIELEIDGPISIVENIDSPSSSERRLARRVTLGSSESAHILPLYLKADDASGVSRLTLITRFPGDAVKNTIELAVRPPYPRITKSGSLSVPPKETRELAIPSDWFPGTRRGALTASGIPAIEYSDAVNFLVSYPYHCLEQTVSSGWALLSQPDIVASLDPELATRAQLAMSIDEKIRRIQSLQMYNGGFSSWPGSPQSNWNSVYATHFLIACEKKGISVPGATLDAALSFLEQLVAFAPNVDGDELYGAELGLRSYICYVLSLRKEAPLAWMSYLKDNMPHMPRYGSIMLAAAYARSGEKEQARAILGGKVPSVVSYEPQTTELYNLDSPIRNQALYLMAWNELDPKGPSAALGASELLKSLRRAGRYTTHEAGFAMPALGDFFAFNSGKGVSELNIKDAKGNSTTISGDEIYRTEISEDESRFFIENTGDTIGYAFWTADGVPTVEQEPEDHGIKASIEYTDSEGFPIGRDAVIKRGERVTGKIVITPLAGESSNIIVSLLLAGGMEIENPKLMDSPQEEYDYGNSSYSTARAELRDDRLLLFVDSLENSFEWKFAMRAVTPGQFTLPPIMAEGMYSPGTRSISESGRITIK